MSVYAPDSEKDHKDDDNSWRERRKFYWIDDGMGPNVPILRSTSTSSWVCCVEAMRRTRSSLCGMYGPHRWQRHGKDPGGFSKLMWYSTMKEFDCRAISTWSSCADLKEMAFTQRQRGENGRTTQLHSLLGSKTDSSVTFIDNQAEQHVGSLSSVCRVTGRRGRTRLRKKTKKSAGGMAATRRRCEQELNSKRK